MAFRQISIKHIGKDITLEEAKCIFTNKDEWELFRPSTPHYGEGFIIYLDDTPVAACMYEKEGFFYGHCLGVNLIEVAKSHRGEGLTTLVAQEVFSIAHTLNKGVRMTEYSPMGIKALKRRFRAFAKAFHEKTDLPFIEGFETVYYKL